MKLGIATRDRANVFLEVNQERARQDQKFGVQNLPSVEPTSDVYEKMPSETLAKAMCNAALRAKQATWLHVAVEELCEASEAPDEEARRAELVQLAAVVIAWIECIDRRACGAV